MDEFVEGFQHFVDAESESPLPLKESPVQATTGLKIASLEHVVSQAIQRIQLLEESIGKTAPNSVKLESDEHLHAFTRITTEIFGEATFSVEVDPESGDHSFVATVSVSGSDMQIDAVCNQWHLRMIEELPEYIGRFALSVQFE